MIINIKEIPVIYICPNHNEKYNKRKLHMDELLTKLKFKNIIHFKSSTEKYPYCLNNATIEIFSKYKPPFLLLEDDIEVTRDIPDNFEIPDNTDAFYLGLSSGGGHKTNNYDDGNCLYEYIDSNLFKINNMLGGHAILYINSNYINYLRNELITKPTYYNDVVMSQIQDKFNIYCNQESYFYQGFEYPENLNSNENATKIILNNKPVIFVTAFININNSSLEDVTKNYFYYFEKLAETGIQIALFLDKLYIEYGETITKKYNNITIIRYLTKEELHINKLKISNVLPKIRNTKKDTEDYLKLMNNKIYFVEEVSNLYNNYTWFSWIDFRIYHILPENNKLNKIFTTYNFSYNTYFPGALTNKKYLVDIINWRFLGGFFIINKTKIKDLVKENKKILEELSILTWEVNIWGIIEYNNLFNFGWYLGDHNINILF